MLKTAQSLRLRYTGHPFVDVGVATTTAFAGKRHPQDVDLDDLERIADYLKEIYCNYKPVQNYISVIFPNSLFSQPKATPEQRETYADRMLFLFRQDYPAEENPATCTFFPEFAAQMNATRQHVPLLNGEEIGNFSSLGRAGLPISGVALLAIHAMPLGCYKCGNLLAF
ncbi:MAG: hypothetical protein K8I82_01700, partial [Anaerolineae bacterium]|nr:hypothetical protein [Anaerolineae bacterium]